MRRIIPSIAYDELPCSIVAVGCALGYTDSESVAGVIPAGLHRDGYLSLRNMESLIRAKMSVTGKVYYKGGKRPTLTAFMEENAGRPAVICLLGHFVYFDGFYYYSFFENENDPVVQAWFVEVER